MPEELIDILHPDGKPAGYARPRREVHRLGLWHRTVHIWVARPPLILLQQRAFDRETHPGLWDISAAGHISSGQSAREAALRELREELGLEIRDSDRLRHIATITETHTARRPDFIDNEFHEIFLIEISASEARALRPNLGEVATTRWISPEEWEQELNSRPTSFVPHPTEYRLILDYLKK